MVLTLACRPHGGVAALGPAATAALSPAATATAPGAGGTRAASAAAAAAAAREALATPRISAVGETVKIDSAALLARGGGKYGEAAALNGAAQSVSLFGPEEKVRNNVVFVYISLSSSNFEKGGSLTTPPPSTRSKLVCPPLPSPNTTNT